MNETHAGAELTETSPELLAALRAEMVNVFGQDIDAQALHTGGGVFVAAIDLSQDGRLMGRQLWLTREGPNEWLLGFYDFAADPEDEGLCVAIRGNVTTSEDGWLTRHEAEDPTVYTANSPLWVAAQVRGILERLGVTRLQGS